MQQCIGYDGIKGMGYPKMMMIRKYINFYFIFYLRYRLNSLSITTPKKMQNNTNKTFMEQQSWLDCIGQLINKNYMVSTQQQVFLEDPIFLDASNITHPPINKTLKTSIQTQYQEPTQLQPQSTGKRAYISMQTEQDKEQNIRQKQVYPIQNQEQSSKQESRQSQKQSKVVKQSQYSKNYRQRKKELLKTLQQQNAYLKQKINQLQMRLRQKQLQINRLKYAPEQKQLSVQQLNEQFLKKTNLMLQKTEVDPVTYGKTIYTPEQKFYNQFIKSYDEHGFGGTRKKNTLNYYFNELLLSIMRDSEKYLFLVCNASKTPEQLHGLQTYEQIDLVFKEIMKLDEDKTERIKHFTNNLHPFMQEIKTICSSMFTNFSKILTFIQKVHNFMKASYPYNMDFARKRIQLQNWFEHNKHTKLIRRLRSQWLQSIKKSTRQEAQEKGNLKNKKKKKTTEMIIKENP